VSKERIRIVVIGGSVRPANYTNRALKLVVKELEEQWDVIVDRIDPAELTLMLPGIESADSSKQEMQALVSKATGVILVTPEYHGSFSSVMKLIIDNLGFPSVLSGKPIGLVGVAAGVIGAIKALEHLRSVTSHIGGLVLPGPVSVAGVQKVFDDDGKCLDPAVEKRIRGAATNLMEYIEKHLCPRISLEEVVRGSPDTKQ